MHPQHRSGPHPAGQVKEGALQRLSAKPGRPQEHLSTETYEAIKLELQNKERALAALSVALAILREKRMRVRGTDNRPVANHTRE